MSQAKLKVTDLKTGQEYLLLPTKLNLKGVLVETTRTLAPGTPVRLSFKFTEGEDPPTNLSGEVHKIAKRPSGGKGMIIRFLDPNPTDTARIADLVERFEQAPTSTQQPISFEERTMMVDLEKSFPSPPTQAPPTQAPPPKVSPKHVPMPSTLDEEAAREGRPMFDGATHVGDLGQYQKFIKRRKRTSVARTFAWILLPAAIGVSAFLFYRPVLTYLDRTFGTDPAPKLKPIVQREVTPTATPTSIPDEKIEEEPVQVQIEHAPPPASTPPPEKPIKKPAATPARTMITRIEVEETQSFLKVTVHADGSLTDVQATRVTSPRRLLLDFQNAIGFKSNPSIAVGKNPLLRIRTTKKGKAVRLILDLYPVDFPRYDVKKLGDIVDIYLHR